MTEKEEQMLQWVDEIREETYQAIKHQSAALRKIAALAVLIVAKPVENEMARPEYETPEKPKLDKVALDIIKEPIADDVLYEDEKTKVEKVGPLIVETKKPKKVRLDDFDTPLDVKDAGTSRDEKIFYYRAQGKTLSWIAKMVGCAPQTVANVINRKKEKEAAKAKSEASYAHIMNGGKA